MSHILSTGLAKGFLCDILQLWSVGFIVNVEIMSDAASKLHFRKLTVTRTDVYGRILLLLQQLEFFSMI